VHAAVAPHREDIHEAVFQFFTLTLQLHSNLLQLNEINGQTRDPSVPSGDRHGARSVKEVVLEKVKNLMLFIVAGRNGFQKIS
jgi:hypothetical protein